MTTSSTGAPQNQGWTPELRDQFNTTIIKMIESPQMKELIEEGLDIAKMND